MKGTESMLNFIRHCIYDGVAEWQAIKTAGNLQPNTVKYLKDGLLRLPFKMKKLFNESNSEQEAV
jgi:hypothetical protein